MTEKFYTIEEKVKLLRVSVAKMRQLVRAGEIESVSIGNQYRISEAQFQTFLDKHTRKK